MAAGGVYFLLSLYTTRGGHEFLGLGISAHPSALSDEASCSNFSPFQVDKGFAVVPVAAETPQAKGDRAVDQNRRHQHWVSRTAGTCRAAAWRPREAIQARSGQVVERLRQPGRARGSPFSVSGRAEFPAVCSEHKSAISAPLAFWTLAWPERHRRVGV